MAEVFEWERQFEEEIRRDLQRSEILDDLRMFINVIASARFLAQGGDLHDHIEVALVAGCPRPHPGKPPSYIRTARRLRLRLRGIGEQESVQSLLRGMMRVQLVETPFQIMLDGSYRWEFDEVFEVRGL